MGLYDEIKTFCERIKLLKSEVSTEEATKMSLIAPFFQLLGYDVFNPNEFCPEYTADVGIKKGEKVDYAIIINNEPIILIEAKAINKNLDKYGSQLFRYFSVTKSKFAILTNGIYYKIYSDLEEDNKMDKEPFFEFSLEELTDDKISIIEKFSKNTFNTNNLMADATIMKYENKFKAYLKKQILEPSDDFIRLFLKNTYSGTKTQNVLDKFKPILKKSMIDFLNQYADDKFSAFLNGSSLPNIEEEKLPSDEEVSALTIVKEILKNDCNVSDITYKITESYFGILFNNNSRKWICRFIIRSNQITIIIPDNNKNEIRNKLTSLNEIYDYSSDLISALHMYIETPKDNIEYILTKWGKIPKPDPYKINWIRGPK